MMSERELIEAYGEINEVAVKLAGKLCKMTFPASGSDVTFVIKNLRCNDWHGAYWVECVTDKGNFTEPMRVFTDLASVGKAQTGANFGFGGFVPFKVYEMTKA